MMNAISVEVADLSMGCPMRHDQVLMRHRFSSEHRTISEPFPNFVFGRQLRLAVRSSFGNGGLEWSVRDDDAPGVVFASGNATDVHDARRQATKVVAHVCHVGWRSDARGRRDPEDTRTTRRLILDVLAASGEALLTTEIVRGVQQASPTKHAASIRAEIARMTELRLIARAGRAGRGFRYMVPNLAPFLPSGADRHTTTAIQPPLRWPGEPLAARVRDLERAADRLVDELDGPLSHAQYEQAVALLERAQAVAHEVLAIDFVQEEYGPAIFELAAIIGENLGEAERRLRDYPDDEVPRLIAHLAKGLARMTRGIARRDVVRLMRG